jgi:hypothetical protein
MRLIISILTIFLTFTSFSQYTLSAGMHLRMDDKLKVRGNLTNYYFLQGESIKERHINGLEISFSHNDDLKYTFSERTCTGSHHYGPLFCNQIVRSADFSLNYLGIRYGSTWRVNKFNPDFRSLRNSFLMGFMVRLDILISKNGSDYFFTELHEELYNDHPFKNDTVTYYHHSSEPFEVNNIFPALFSFGPQFGYRLSGKNFFFDINLAFGINFAPRTEGFEIKTVKKFFPLFVETGASIGWVFNKKSSAN